MFLKEDIRGILDYNWLQTIEHYFEKHNKGGASHQKGIEKWIWKRNLLKDFYHYINWRHCGIKKE